MIERWKPVPDYEDLYHVSDRGRVRRIAGGNGARRGHILRPQRNRGGYLQVHLSRYCCRKMRTVHTLVMEAFRGPCPAGMEVNHKYGIKDDNRLTELEYLTRGENLKHSYCVLGRKAPVLCGEANGHVKLTASAVRQIRKVYAEGGATQCELGKRHGVSHAAISRVVRREHWAHVA